VATNNVNEIGFATNCLPVLSFIVNQWHDIAVWNDVLETHMTLAWLAVYPSRLPLTNVLLFRSSAETGGSKESRDSIAFGPLIATAGTPVCAPVIIAKPPPVAFYVSRSLLLR
jgi:hypothetical protein